MSKVLALLSGKGGSGKTTLALSIASMLSNCNLKVLLVDCDLSTNGATYFYEGKLSENPDAIWSFNTVFLENKFEELELVKINQYLNFMPSITRITKSNTETYSYKETDLVRAQYINDNFKKQYDVIVYDCQAGYTDVLRLLLRFVDVNLVVMEADAISSAAIRSFYLKVGDIINERKVYQIFNKATDEEYEIYSKISGGTVFTNIETVMFDWKIRKAFSVAQIPDMECTSAGYGEQVFNICKILFKDEKIQEKLKKYETIILINKKEEEEEELRSKINEKYKECKSIKNKFIRLVYTLGVPALMLLAYTIFTTLVNTSFFIKEPINMIMLIIIFLTGVCVWIIEVISLNDLAKERRNSYRELSIDNRKLDEILEEKNKLLEKLNNIEKKE